MVRPRGFSSISSAEQATYQVLTGNMQVSFVGGFFIQYAE
jgi:hypothetical protein